MDRIYKCNIECSFRVKDTHKELIAEHTGNIIGFTLPNGKTVRPIIGLEVTSKDESHFQDITSEFKMDKIGFEDLDYDVSNFEEWEEASETLENNEYEDMSLKELPINLDARFKSSRAIIERRLKEGK